MVHLSTASDTFYTQPTCAIRSDRTVWCWGYSTISGNAGGLFQGSTGSNNSVPYAVPIAAAAADGGPPPPLVADRISVGGGFACALSSGKVSCWGTNTQGPLANGDMSLAFQPYPLPILTGLGLPATVDAIGCGYNFACALAGGKVWCWGASGDGQEGNPSVPTDVQLQLLPAGARAGAGVASRRRAESGRRWRHGPGSAVERREHRRGLPVRLCARRGRQHLVLGREGGGQSVRLEATPLTSAVVPTTQVTRLTATGEDWSGLIYTTASGSYVNGSQGIVPSCQ